MKAVLVIDLPEGYETEDLLIDYCLHTKGEYRSVRKSGNNPMKPLPAKMVVSKLSVRDQEETELCINMAMLKVYADGYNACLKEIEGD